MKHTTSIDQVFTHLSLLSTAKIDDPTWPSSAEIDHAELAGDEYLKSDAIVNILPESEHLRFWVGRINLEESFEKCRQCTGNCDFQQLVVSLWKSRAVYFSSCALNPQQVQSATGSCAQLSDICPKNCLNRPTLDLNLSYRCHHRNIAIDSINKHSTLVYRPVFCSAGYSPPYPMDFYLDFDDR